MEKKISSSLVLVAALIMVSSCTDQPKVIQAVATSNETEIKSAALPDGHAVSFESPTQPVSEVHQVTVKEILPTTRYVYALVKENDSEYWVATNKMALEIGATYYYKNGLLKSNFLSKEHNRTFEKLYLVSSLVPNNHGLKSGETPTKKAPVANTKFVPADGSVKIADIIANPAEYAGKTIQVSGECTKVNPNIMKRHWIHLKDGSKDDYDFVVTSQTQIPVGHAVTFTGTINLKRDFGSGYYYEILMEDAVVIGGS